MLAAAPDIGPKGNWLLDLGAGEEHRDRRAGHVARDEVDALEHRAEHAGGDRRSGSRLSTPASGSVRASAGSPRCVGDQRRGSPAMRSTGSSIVSGTGKRAGTNWLPATPSVASVRMLIGIVIRSASTGAPWRSW